MKLVYTTPIKREGEKWIITDKNQKDWYDYSNYEPAYMMLNDGVYQSELVVNMKENGKKLASENLGVEIKQEELGTIYMWVPRFEIVNNSLVYIKQECKALGDYEISNMFISEADKWDYSYAGAWIEYAPLESETALVNKVNNLNKGETDEVYGFLANTKAYRYDSFSMRGGFIYYSYALSEKTTKYVNNLAELNDIVNNTNVIKNANNENRTVLRVSQTNKLEPIKATSHYDTESRKIIIEITHNKNEIKEVLFEENEKLEFATINGKTIANTGEIEIATGRYKITIIDVEGNAYEFIANGEPIYATLYTDGILGLSTGKTTISGKTVSVSYGDIQLSSNYKPWSNDVSKIKTVNIVNKIRPISTGAWFSNCTNLTTINNIANLDTSKVTIMGSMFNGCSALTSLDVSKFDTSKVTNMYGMFSRCSALTSLDVSKFDTSKVTNMSSMFEKCYRLTTLDVSKWDTSKVTSMAFMFAGDASTSEYKYMNLRTLDLSNFNTSNVTSTLRMFLCCNQLTTLNVSNFDTSKVTSMNLMFYGCSKLTRLDLSKWDTSKVTDMDGMFYGCSALTNLNVSNFNTSNVTSMRIMFELCSKLTTLDLSSFNTSNVIDMSYMFYYCSNLKTIYVGTNWKLASTRPDMFTRCGTSTTTRK